MALTAAGTLTSAWRWRTVARAYGVPLTRRESLTAYYRSQFLNATLPGGILGDAHRAVRHGRDVGDVPAGVRATVWERVSGQIVQLGLVLLVLATLASPLRPLAPLAVGGLLVVGVAGWLRAPARRRIGGRPACPARPGHPGPASSAPRAARPWATSRSSCSRCTRSASTRRGGVLVTTGLVVMVGSSVPLNIAGWGPREGLTAWAFGLAGLGSAAGLTVSVVYGVLAAIATLPGALVLVADAAARRTRATVDVHEPVPRRDSWRECAVAERPYTLLSCSMSIDGYIDGASESRLLLSNELDFDRVDRVRAGVDAILVGATTVRNDNPRLLVRRPRPTPATRPVRPARSTPPRSPSPSAVASTRRHASSPTTAPTRWSTAAAASSDCSSAGWAT